HRDLKPANILIEKAGEARLRDFGLAKQVGGSGSSPHAASATLSALTHTGQILGTPSYMPPEQAGAQRGAVGPPADIYALGAVLYCLLTGRPPFQAASPLGTLLPVPHNEPAPPRQLNAAIPRDLETICLKCLNKEPAKRYASAQDLVADLERYLNGQPIVARPTGVGERVWKWAKRRPATAALLLITAIEAVGLPVILATLLYNAEERAKMVQDLSAATHDLDAARVETAKEQKLAKDAQASLKEAKIQQLLAQHDVHVQKILLAETQKKLQVQEKQAREMQIRAQREAAGLRLIGQSSALRVNNPGLALLLALEGQKLTPGVLANNALREAIDECHEERTLFTGNAWSSALYSPDGKLILSLPW